jgi:hypothetical protein
MNESVCNAFNNCRKFIRIGFLCTLNLLVSVYTIFCGINPLMLDIHDVVYVEQSSSQDASSNSTTSGGGVVSEASFDQSLEYTMPLRDFELHLFFFMMPLTMLLHNFELARTYSIKEKPLILVFKAIIFTLFYVMLLVAFLNQNVTVVLGAHILFIGVGFFSLFYTYCLFSKIGLCCIYDRENN